MDSTTRTTQESARQGLVRNRDGTYRPAEEGESPIAVIVDSAGNPVSEVNLNNYFFSEHVRKKAEEEFKAQMLAEAKARMNDRSHLSVQEQLNILVAENRGLTEGLKTCLLAINGLSDKVTTLEHRIENVSLYAHDVHSDLRRLEQRMNGSITGIANILTELEQRITDLDRVALKVGGNMESTTEERKIEV